MPHPSEFDLAEMIALGASLRSMGGGAAHMEEAADRIVHRLYRAFATDPGVPSTLALCRFYVTARFGDLDEGLKSFAVKLAGGAPAPETRCLTLLASQGAEPAWGSRHNSVGHKAIPLSLPDFAARMPMAAGVFQKFGLEPGNLATTDLAVLHDARQFGIFLVEDAKNSPALVDHADFVEKYGIQSALGFGGVLPNVRGRGDNHELFLVLLFSKAKIPPEMADLLAPVALSVKLAVVRFCGGQRIFAPKGDPEPPSTGPANDLAQQRARAMALEQLLEVHEGVVAAQSKRLQAAVAKATHRAAELRRSEGAVRKQAEILENVIRSMRDAIAVCDETGRLILLNPAAKLIFSAGPPRVAGTGPDASPAANKQVVRERGLYLPDGVTPHPVETLPMVRALRGETVDQAEIWVKNPNIPLGAAYSVTANPIRRQGGAIAGVVAVFRDVTEGRSLARQLEERHSQLQASERAQTELVERLRLAVEDLSTPILEVWDDVLALPIIGVVDARRANQTMDRLLDEIVRKKPRFVIIDLTGVKLMDRETAEHFVQLIRSVELVGAKCVLTGIQPGVSQTIVAQGLDLGPVPTLRNLKHALRASARRVSADSVSQEAEARGYDGAPVAPEAPMPEEPEGI